MQIHELNNFTGTLGSGAYLAVDDGNDTGKLSTQQLLAATEARIDNIIAGPAPSAEEIVDARLGDDGVTYPSLGDAIRDQVGDLKSDFSGFKDGQDWKSYTIIENSYPKPDGTFPSINNWRRTGFIPVNGNQTIYIVNPYRTTDNAWYDENQEIISMFTLPVGNPAVAVAPENARYMVVSNYPNQWFSAIYVDQTYYASAEDLKNISDLDTPIANRTTWANKRVTSSGLVNSPSQLTSERILYVGKGNIIRIETDNADRSLSISYYTVENGVYTYIQSDITNIPYLKYVYAKYDYLRISLVGTSANPPLLSEFSIDMFRCRNSEFAGKKIAFLGDSITTYAGVSETDDTLNEPYYPTSDVTNYEQTYAKMFFDACGGDKISVSAISNSSWRNQGNPACPSAYEDARITRLSTNGIPDYVFINMGTNDPYSSNIGNAVDYTYDVTTLSAEVVYTVYAIQLTIRKIQVAYPNAKIILLIPKFASAIGSGNYTFEKWEKVCDFIKEVGDMYGVYKILDLRKCGITVETFSTDCIASKMHPNYNGMKKMGAYIIKELMFPY